MWQMFMKLGFPVMTECCNILMFLFVKDLLIYLRERRARETVANVYSSLGLGPKVGAGNVLQVCQGSGQNAITSAITTAFQDPC